jgi:ABC-type branched-subunit amino acid transport system permease subunit
MHRPLGAVLGALFVAIVPQYLSGSLQGYSALTYGVLLTLVFMWVRNGLIGLVDATVSTIAAGIRAVTHRLTRSQV